MGVLKCLGGMVGLGCSGLFGGMGFAAMRTCLVRMRKWRACGSWGGFLFGFLVGGNFGGFEIFAGLNWKVNCQVAILKY